MALTPAEKQARLRERRAKGFVFLRLEIKRRDIARLLMRHGLIGDDAGDDTSELEAGLLRYLTEKRNR